MSRVDEALRRAAGPVPAADIIRPGSAARTFEDYPIEDRRPEPAHVVEAIRPAPHMPAALREFPSAAPTAPAAPPAPVVAPRTAGPHQITRLAPDVEGKIVIDDEVSAMSIEEYRRLATSLHLMQSQKALQTLIVSSALPRDGKTLTSTNLALTFSESYKRRVLLIDADLRRPSVHTVFRVPNTVGLADALRGDGPVVLSYIEVSNYLTILPAGAPDSAPMAGLTSERMRTVISEARNRFDWVIVDTPPVGLISDANILGDLADGVLLVVGAGATPFPAVQRALTEFGRDRIVGVVLNRVNDDIGGQNRYYGAYYPSHRESVAK